MMVGRRMGEVNELGDLRDLACSSDDSNWRRPGGSQKRRAECWTIVDLGGDKQPLSFPPFHSIDTLSTTKLSRW
jgi:hypothetical protein